MSNICSSIREDFNERQESPSIYHSSRLTCICCLDENAKYVNILSNCYHAEILESLTKIKIERFNQNICYECYAFIIKIGQFKQQVEDSFYVLSSRLSNKSKTNDGKRLRKAHQKNSDRDDNDKSRSSGTTDYPQCLSPGLEMVETSNGMKVKSEIPAEEIKLESNIVTKTEVLSDNDLSEDDCGSPLIKTFKEFDNIFKNECNKKYSKASRQKRQTEKDTKRLETIRPKPQKHSLTDNKVFSKYEGKIKAITLTEDELNAERARGFRGEKYLRLPFKCETCIIGFDYAATLKSHSDRSHNPEKGSFICKICESVLGTDGSYKNHVTRHYKRYECMQCAKRYTHMYPIIKHYNDLHEEVNQKLYKCRHCDFNSANHRSYRYHVEKHKGKRQCAECGKTFVNNAGLKDHVLSFHEKTRVFECEPCGKVYRNRSGLQSHRQSCHGKHKLDEAYCVDCGTQFKSKHTYLTHLKTHSNHRAEEAMKYQCDECGSKFQKKGVLSAHINFKHLNNTKYKCILCNNKSFRNRHDLNKHTDRVHVKKPVPRNKICDYCGRGFTSAQILKTHIRTHTGERPLQCKHCPADFAHPGALYTHNKLLHNNIVKVE